MDNANNANQKNFFKKVEGRTREIFGRNMGKR